MHKIHLAGGVREDCNRFFSGRVGHGGRQ
jgi:hypothetical protein